MPVEMVNGINLSFDVHGSGEPVMLITGNGVRGRTWAPHQVPALTAAGYQVITMDNRGTPPTDACPGGFTIKDMADDIAGLADFLRLRPIRIVGFSLGSVIVQELLLTSPDLVSQAVLMATRGRTDALHAAILAAESDLADSGVAIPPRYAAAMRAIQNLSPHTLNDEQQVRDWLDIFEFSDTSEYQARPYLSAIGNRLERLRGITVSCLVIAFGDDLISPPHRGQEVAENIPHCQYREIPQCGHYGFLENPGLVNSVIIDFFHSTGPAKPDAAALPCK